MRSVDVGGKRAALALPRRYTRARVFFALPSPAAVRVTRAGSQISETAVELGINRLCQILQGTTVGETLRDGIALVSSPVGARYTPRARNYPTSLLGLVGFGLL